MYLLNIRLGEILNNKPKKYKTNYADEIIKTALSALSHLQLADSIYLTKYLTKEEFLIRHNALILARGETQHIATACYIFLEIVRKHDYASESTDCNGHETVYDQERDIGGMCETCYVLINGIIKSDRDYYRKNIEP